MKQTIKRCGFGLLMILVISNFSACQTYEDGPLFSLRSKRERVTNNWRAWLLSRNEIDDLDRFDTYQLNFSKGGEFEWITRLADDSTEFRLSGSWDLAKNKRAIRLNYQVPDPAGGTMERLLFMDIRRLKEKELWISYIWEEDNYYVRLIP